MHPPAPSSVAPLASPWPLTGRDEELAALRRSGEPRHAVLAGNAGVGKTRLVRELIGSRAGEGVRCVRIAASEAASTIPLGAFAGALRGMRPDRPDAFALMMTAAEVLVGEPGGPPLLLAIDDAHHLDPTSATLVGHLAAMPNVTLVLTVRSGAPCPDPVVNLWKDGDGRRLELQPLSREETAALLQRALGGRVASHTVAWAFRSSEGNPMYLRELVDGALTDGSLRLEDGLWQVGRDTRPSLRLTDLVRVRLAGLDDEQTRVVELIALGEPLPAATLARLAGPATVDQLERRGLLRMDVEADGELTARLGHPLYGEVVRTLVAPGVARGLRHELASALTAAPSGRDDDELRIATWLFDAGERPDPARLTRAARLAAAALDHRLAARLAEAAAEAGSGLEAVVGAAAAHRALGDFARAEQLLDTAEADAAAYATRGDFPRADGADDRPVRDYVFARVASLHWGLGRLADAADLLDRAERWSSRPGWVQWVRGQRVTQLSTGGRLAEAVDEGASLLALPDLSPVTRLPLAVGHAYAWHQTGRVTDSLRLIDAAVAAAPGATVDWPPDAMWALVAIRGGTGWPEAGARLLALRDAALAGQDVGTAGWAELLLGQLELGRGRVDAALDRLAEAETHLTVRDSRGLLPSCRALRVVALGHAGRDTDETAAWRGRPRGDMRWMGRAERTAADVWALAAVGRYSAAATAALDFAAVCDQAPLVRAGFLHDAVRLGHPAREVLSDLRRAAGATDSPLASAAVLHATGLVRRDGGTLDAAAAAFRSIGADLLAAECASAAVAAHRAAGHPARATDSAGVLETTRRAARGGDTPALRTSSETAGLTGREREIAVLAARGLPNARIAEQLVLSVRTVESHLYRAMTKVGVTRREELGSQLGVPAS